ncbi:hypothetical protein ACFMQL_35465 [Nonomuraea fastidiosa]|uniref:hypothetical protein n=1 Tax=Nonomuraea TaxID=83681 RepID=UPI003244B7AA
MSVRRRHGGAGRGKAEQAQGAGSGGFVAVGADGEFDEGGVGHGGAGGAVAFDDGRGGDGEAVEEEVVEGAWGVGAFEPDGADLFVVEEDGAAGGRRVECAVRGVAVGGVADGLAGAVEPDAGDAFSEAGRGAGEGGQVDTAAHQRVVEHDDADGAACLGIELRQSYGECLHA